MYLDSLEDLFTAPKERTFTDRAEILELLNEALTKLNEGSNIFQVFSIHGIGGIGKTRLTLYYQNTLGLTFNQIITFKHDQSMESNSVILHVSSISSQSVDV